MKTAIAQIYKEAQKQRLDKACFGRESSHPKTACKIVSIRLEVEGKQLKYSTTNYNLSHVEDRLSYKLDGAIAMLDKEAFDLIEVKNKIEADPNCQVFLIGLKVAENRFRIVWIFDADESSFCSTVEQIINQHYRRANV